MTMPRRARVPEGKAVFSAEPTPTPPDPSAEGKALFFATPEQPDTAPPDSPAAADGWQIADVAEPESGAETLAGRQLGPFRVGEELGRGPTGVVYRASAGEGEAEVAIKAFHPWLAGQPGFLGALRRELRALGQLHHLNIAPVRGLGECESCHYLATHLVAGRSLAQVVGEDSPLPAERALSIAIQVAVALDYAHKQRLVHGGIKPTNIILGEGDRAVLVDFALARLADDAVRRSAGGVVLGEPQHLAPELLAGQPASHAADRYAFAVVLFTLLAGRPPFLAASPLATLLKQVGDDPPPLSTLRPDLPAALDAVLARALAKDPAARYPSCAVLVRAATEALRGEVVGPAVRTVPPEPTARSRWWPFHRADART